MATHLPYTLPVMGDHPRIWCTEDTALSIASRANASSLWYPFYTAMNTWCSAHASDSASAFALLDSEYILAFAFQAIANKVPSYVDKAINYALTLASSTIPTDSGSKRRQITSMAMIYDWCYTQMTSTQRNTIRETGSSCIITRANGLAYENPSEYIWGHSGEHNNALLLALAAILSDSSSGTVNIATRNTFEAALDAWDDGTDQCYSRAFRYFGDVDGGTCKGSQPFGYVPLHEEYMCRQWPALKTAVDVDVYVNEPWWSLWIDWLWWHWRSDGGAGGIGHGQNDGQRMYHFAINTQCHALQVSQALGPTSDLGIRAWRLHKLIESQNDAKIWGPYHLHNLFFNSLDLNWDATGTWNRPIIGTLPGSYPAGLHGRYFEKAKKICYHTSWEPPGAAPAVSGTLSGQRFTGIHGHRDLGHYDLTYAGEPLLVQHGTYNPKDNPYTYKYIQADGTILQPNTGMTWSYYKRIISKNCLRIWDSNEKNEIPSYSVMAYGGGSHFGIRDYSAGEPYVDTISYIGDQLWPKPSLDPKIYWIYDIGMFEQGTPENYPTAPWFYETVSKYEETEKYVYVVIDMHHAYYTAKCQRAKRHWLMLKRNVISDIETLIIWDDVTTHVDSSKQEETVVSMLQTRYRPVITAGNKIWTTGPRARLRTQVLSPVTMSTRIVEGWKDVVGYSYPSSKDYAYDDSRSGYVFRTEVWPSSVGTGPWWNQAFLFVHHPLQLSTPESTLPLAEIAEDVNYFGVRFEFTRDTLYGDAGDKWRVQFRKGDTHSVQIVLEGGVLPPPTKPSAPSGLVATAGNAQVSVDWNDNTEADLAGYILFERSRVGLGVWSAFHEVLAGLASSYVLSPRTNGTTYQYYMTAYNTALVQSDPSPLSNEVTPADPPPPPPPPPDPGPVSDNRRLAIGLHFVTSGIPAPSADNVISEGDKAHFEQLYTEFDYQPPPKDYTVGKPVEDVVDEEIPGGAIGGSCMAPAAGISGAPIEDSHPSPPEPGEEISSESQ